MHNFVSHICSRRQEAIRRSYHPLDLIMEILRIFTCSVEKRRNALGVGLPKLCKLICTVCMLVKYVAVEVAPTISLHANGGAPAAFPFLFGFIVQCPV